MLTDSGIEWVLATLTGLSAALLVWAATIRAGKGDRSAASPAERRSSAGRRDELEPVNPLSTPFVTAGLLGGCVVMGLLLGSVFIAAALAAAVTLLPALLRRWRSQRLFKTYDQQWPDCLMMIAGGMRAGLSLSGAMGQVVTDLQYPMSREIGKVLRDQRLGLPLSQALIDLGRRMPTPTTVLVTSAMAIATESGGALAETLERTSSTARRQLETAAKIDALTSQGRMQATVIGAMPLLLLLVLSRLEEQAMQLLWTTPVGLGVCALIVVLEVCGVMMIRRISTIDF